MYDNVILKVCHVIVIVIIIIIIIGCTGGIELINNNNNNNASPWLPCNPSCACRKCVSSLVTFRVLLELRKKMAAEKV